MTTNKTKEDAFRRVVDAKLGCLDGATPEYVEALIHYLQDWTADMQHRLRTLGPTASCNLHGEEYSEEF